MALAFSAKEYAERQKQLLTKMAEDKIDAVLLFSQESMYWLTGYDTSGFCLFQCLIVTADGEKTLLTRAPDLRQARATSNIENIVLWRDREKANPAFDLRNLLNEFDLLGCRIGIEYQAYGLDGADCRLLDEQLANFAKIIDISGTVDRFRLIKSNDEIACIRKAAELTDKGLDDALPHIKSEASEAHILAALINANIANGGDFPASEYVVGSGPDALLCQYKSGRRKLAKRDQLTIQWSGVCQHYHAPMMRTIIIGKPEKRHIELYDAARASMEAIEKAMVPGASFDYIFNIHAGIMEEHALTRHRFNTCGYSVGARFAPSWMESEQFKTGNTLTIQPNMALLAHCMLFDSEAGAAMTLAQTYLITPKGAESLSRHSLDLITR